MNVTNRCEDTRACIQEADNQDGTSWQGAEEKRGGRRRGGTVRGRLGRDMHIPLSQSQVLYVIQRNTSPQCRKVAATLGGALK